MSLINEAVMEKFSVWAAENEDKDIFPSISHAEESYYIDRRSDETYMIEYSFQTLAELKKALEQYSGLSDNEQILKMMTIEICQNMFRSESVNHEAEETEEPKRSKDNKTLPEFIYVF